MVNTPLLLSRDICSQGHIAMTYTAVLTLVALGDDLSRLNKEAVITGIGSLQQPNGSFRSLSSPGECDTRFLYCACAVSHVLDDWRGVDKKLAVRYVRSCMSYEGGIALVPGDSRFYLICLVFASLVEVLFVFVGQSTIC